MTLVKSLEKSTLRYLKLETISTDEEGPLLLKSMTISFIFATQMQRFCICGRYGQLAFQQIFHSFRTMITGEQFVHDPFFVNTESSYARLFVS